MSIYEVHVIPVDEGDLPDAETLTCVFSNFVLAISYARHLHDSTNFTANEIIIECYESFDLSHYNSLERLSKYGK